MPDRARNASISASSLQYTLEPDECTPSQPKSGMYSLGSVVYGGNGSKPVRGKASVDLHVPLITDSDSAWRECWYSRTPVKKVQHGSVCARYNQHILWGCFSCPIRSGEPYARAVQWHYVELFEFLQLTGFMHLWRIWNFIPYINNVDSNGLENYRSFNEGRMAACSEGYERCTKAIPWGIWRMPAATAIGCGGQALQVYFLAGRKLSRHIENPRQQPAYHYPAEYGPCPPSFARASVIDLPGQHIFFASGTASIIGHQTVHVSDLPGQCRTLVENLQIIAARGGRSLQQLTHFRVYVRHARDLQAVKTLIPALLRVSSAHFVYFVADTCRQDLLVEMEGMQI